MRAADILNANIKTMTDEELADYETELYDLQSLVEELTFDLEDELELRKHEQETA